MNKANFIKNWEGCFPLEYIEHYYALPTKDLLKIKKAIPIFNQNTDKSYIKMVIIKILEERKKYPKSIQYILEIT